jgi:hypothetical protein
MLVSRTAAQTVDIDARWMPTIAVVDGPVVTDDQPGLPGAIQDRATLPDAFHSVTTSNTHLRSQ